MSHGIRGVLHGGDSHCISWYIPINDILHITSRYIPKSTPKVRKHTNFLKENSFQVFVKIQISADITIQLVKLAVCLCKVGQPSVIVQQNAYLRHNFFPSF